MVSIDGPDGDMTYWYEGCMMCLWFMARASKCDMIHEAQSMYDGC